MADRITDNILRGSFTGTGQSSEIIVTDRGLLSLDFGTGSVTLERQGPQGKWVAVVDGTWTADAAVNVEGRGQNFRLNCTSYSAEIFYSLVG